MEMEDILLEYEEYRGPEIDAKVDARYLIVSSLYDLEDLRDDFIENVQRNLKMYKTGNRINKIAEILTFIGYQDMGYLSDDAALLKKHYDINIEFMGYQAKLLKILSEDNFKEVGRLSDFTNKIYLDNFKHIESLRDGVENKGFGYSSVDFRTEDSTRAFKEFFDYQMETKFNIKSEDKICIKK